jgi:nucleoside-diphosphate-sugar epimerase
MFRCLVTGGSGFIGSYLVEGLLARGCDVRVLDDFSTGKAANPGQLHYPAVMKAPKYVPRWSRSSPPEAASSRCRL